MKIKRSKSELIEDLAQYISREVECRIYEAPYSVFEIEDEDPRYAHSNRSEIDNCQSVYRDVATNAVEKALKWKGIKRRNPK